MKHPFKILVLALVTGFLLLSVHIAYRTQSPAILVLSVPVFLITLWWYDAD